VSRNKLQRVVAMDSMVLVWGVRKSGTPEDIKRAGFLFKELEQDEAQIIIPSIVVAEFITPIRTSEGRARTVAAMSERFFIAPFDAMDAVLAAELWNAGKSRREMGKRGARVCLRADALIVATAKNHGAKEFFTNDDTCFRMAESVMTATRLPKMAPDLFSQ